MIYLISLWRTRPQPNKKQVTLGFNGSNSTKCVPVKMVEKIKFQDRAMLVLYVLAVSSTGQSFTCAAFSLLWTGKGLLSMEWKLSHWNISKTIYLSLHKCFLWKPWLQRADSLITSSIFLVKLFFKWKLLFVKQV